jgi:hypothetical protein
MHPILAWLVAMAVLASCRQSTPSVAPTGALASDPVVSNVPIGATTEAFIATLPQAKGVPTGVLQVELVSSTGVRRPVLTIADVTAGLPEDTSPKAFEPIRVSPGGFLTMAVSGSFVGVGDDQGNRRLIFDLRHPGIPPLVVPAGLVAWGPDGRLAIIGGPGVRFVDPVSGEIVVATVTDDVSISTIWAADGSGLFALRAGAGDTSLPGVFAPDGRFTDGLRPSYATTGLGRTYGADGAIVGDAVSEGPTGAEQIILEERPAPARPLPWLVVHQPGPDPDILDHSWDGAGTGQWVLLGRDGETRLVHLAGPGRLDDRATLQTTVARRIEGVRADDTALVVAADGVDETGLVASLTWVDVATGATVSLERAGGISWFAGWATVP